MKYNTRINSNYNVGIYIRLSREDDDKTIESESITNQKSLLMQYVKENNLKVYDMYIDDGYSGTNFERPGFKKMIDDIENKRINMVITKDMSRLGRDYIGTGNLIERYFPEHNIRYIAVTDNIDTYLENSNNDIAPFKAIMNDMYAKDISKKIKSSLKAKQKEGKWVGGRCPFGYDIDPENKNHLIINEEKARIVKRIYKMFLDGNTYFKIARRLTQEHIKTPAQYYNFKWNSNYNTKFGKWNSKSVEDILKNRIYTGDLVQNKRNKVNYKIKKVVKNDPKDYIIVENTHEAIIDKDTFFNVQSLLPKYVGRNEKKEYHLFDGLLYCGDCGHRISIQPRRKIDNNCYTICNYYRSYIKLKVCTIHCNNYDKLEMVLLDNLKNACKDYIDSKKVKSIVLEKTKNDKKDELLYESNKLSNEIKNLNDNLDNVYLDKISKKITDAQYERVKIKVENDILIKTKRLDAIENLLSENVSILERKKKINKYIDDFLSMENPTRELIVNLVEKVEIFDDKTINIKLAFKP